jgi:hypothetical protein
MLNGFTSLLTGKEPASLPQRAYPRQLDLSIRPEVSSARVEETEALFEISFASDQNSPEEGWQGHGNNRPGSYFSQ